jgi:heptaprenylglyceryl phosphate synthase
MQALYHQLCSNKANKIKQLALLLDPEKINWDAWESTIHAIQHSPVNLILVGGSSHSALAIDELVQALKKAIDLPLTTNKESHEDQNDHDPDCLLPWLDQWVRKQQANATHTSRAGVDS